MRKAVSADGLRPRGSAGGAAVIEQTARVIDVEGEFALVEPVRTDSCGGCSAKAACGTSLVASLLGRRNAPVRVINSVGARRGDSVILGLPESALTQGALLLYILPLATMLAAALLMQWAASAVPGLATEAAAIGGGFLGLAGGLLAMARLGRRLETRRGFGAVIVRAAEPGAARVVSFTGHTPEA